MSLNPDVGLSPGDIPMLGLGTFQSDPKAYPPGSVKDSVLIALKIGYRHIDTAMAYGNGQVEKEVGEAFREIAPTGNLLLIHAFEEDRHNTFHEPQGVEVGLDMTLKNLGMDYVDLFLMHNPYAYAHDESYDTLRKRDGSGKPSIDVATSRNYPDTWKAMAALIQTGKVKAVGLSNFNVLKLKRLIAETGVVPVCNQVEFNPFFLQKRLHDFCKLQGIQLVAHCPLGGSLASTVAGRKGGGPLDSPVIIDIAEKHGKTPAQIILAWIIGRGVCAIPKSNSETRIKENFYYQVALTQEDDLQIGSLVGMEPNGDYGVRNLDPTHHLGFDPYDEEIDQPV